jgi:hypothetical protein
LLARFEEAAAEEPAAGARGRGRAVARGRGRGRGRGRAAGVEQPNPIGQGAPEDEEEEEQQAPPPRQRRGRGNPPPPPEVPLPQPPNMAEVMATQTQLLQRMAESMLQGNQQGHRQGHQGEDLQRKIERFIRLKAPTFDYSDDPLEADDWLKVIETKLDLTDCSDEECVALAAHQLAGSAKAWWDSYCDSHPDPAHITWLEFCEAFREHHVPRQLMVHKADEFRTMTQGTMKVEEYARHFTKMMRYAPDETRTDEQR